MWLSDIPGPRLFIKKLPDTFPERNVSLTTLLRAEKVRKVRGSDRIAFIPITGVKKASQELPTLEGMNVKKKKKLKTLSSQEQLSLSELTRRANGACGSACALFNFD